MADSDPRNKTSEITRVCRMCLSTDCPLEPMANNDSGEYLFQNIFACTSVQMMPLAQCPSYLCTNCKSHLNNVHPSRDKCSQNFEMVKRFKVDPTSSNESERLAENSEDCLDRTNGAVPVSVKNEAATEHQENISPSNKADFNSLQKSTTYNGYESDPGLNSVLWWSDDLTALRVECVRARRRLHRRRESPEVRAARVTDFRLARNLYKKERRRSRRQYEAELALFNLTSDVSRLRLLNWDEWY